VLCGSDWPFCDEHVVAEEVGLLTAPNFLTPDAVKMIESGNAADIFPGRL
jgi:hypothetical protein